MKKMWSKCMGGQDLAPALNFLIIMTSLQNIVINFWVLKVAGVDGIKIFDEDDQATKH